MPISVVVISDPAMVVGCFGTQGVVVVGSEQRCLH